MSGRSIRLSLKSAKALCELAQRHAWATHELEAQREIERALAPRKPAPSFRHAKPTKLERRKSKVAKKASKRERRSGVREQVMARAGGRCECGCGHPFVGDFLFKAELDHNFGRSRAESVETCWALTARCHDHKSRNFPSAAHWLGLFIAHAEKHGYAREAERARARLEGIVAVREQERAR